MSKAIKSTLLYCGASGYLPGDIRWPSLWTTWYCNSSSVKHRLVNATYLIKKRVRTFFCSSWGSHLSESAFC